MAEVQYKANGAFTRTLMFLHDENGAIVGVGVKNAGETSFTSYYYAKNLQGDVVAVYRSDYNSTSQTYYPTLVASYEYDPWGKVISVKGSSGAILSLEAYPNHIAHVNPIRYRGYYYDNETGFYYLQSRYYDPAISRFINADSYGSTGQAFLGTNMFAYCNNNPVDRVDSTGNSWKKAEEFSKQADEKVKEYLTPSNEYGTVVGFASIGVASACAVAKRAISMAVRPSNIGIGSFTKQCASDLCNVSRFDTISSRAFSTAAYGVALMDVGIGIYDKAVPLRYNNDKRKKPLFSRGLSVCRHFYGQLCGCPEILKKSCKFFCRGLDIRVYKIMHQLKKLYLMLL